jgi:response regulator NasT
MKLRVMVVDKSKNRSELLEQALIDAGYEVVAKLNKEHNLQAHVNQMQPDVIIIDMDSPGRDILEHMHSITREQPKPIVMFSDDSSSETINEALRAGVSAYIVDGLNPKRVKPIVDVALARFKEFQALRNELEKTKTTLAERKVVDKAKGILMQQRRFTEEEAYKALRKMAMDKNKRIAEIAENIIEVSKFLS